MIWKIIILGGNFNLFLDSALEAEGGSPVLKKSSVSKLIEIKEKYNLCDIWRIRNTKEKRFTFRQKHLSGFLQRRLDYFFVSNNLQESIKDTEILPTLSSDHSPIFFSLVSTKPASKGKRLWKFNNSLLLNAEFVTKMRNYIHLKINEMKHENINDDQIQWQFLKYMMRKFSRKFSKILAKELREELRILENKLKLHEQNLKCIENEDYLRCKLKLEEIYKIEANGVKIRSKCDWYEYGEKSSKFFLNLEKNRFVQFRVRFVN